MYHYSLLVCIRLNTIEQYLVHLPSHSDWLYPGALLVITCTYREIDTPTFKAQFEYGKKTCSAMLTTKLKNQGPYLQCSFINTVQTGTAISPYCTQYSYNVHV